LERRVEKRDLANVTVIRGAFDDPRLPPASCDLVFFSSVYKEIDERPRYLQHVMKTLKPGGRVAILEYRPQTREPGPPREHRLSEETVLAEMGAAGFELVERHDFLPREYFLVFGLARREGSPGADSSVCVRAASAPHSPSGPMTQRSPRPPALPWQRRIVPLAPSDGERVRVRGDFVHPSPGSLHGYITLQVPLQVGPVELAAGTRLFR
jgi:SAM-dependent methyltransferase